VVPFGLTTVSSLMFVRILIPARIACRTLWLPTARQGRSREFLGSTRNVPLIR